MINVVHFLQCRYDTQELICAADEVIKEYWTKIHAERTGSNDHAILTIRVGS